MFKLEQRFRFKFLRYQTHIFNIKDLYINKNTKLFYLCDHTNYIPLCKMQQTRSNHCTFAPDTQIKKYHQQSVTDRK